MSTVVVCPVYNREDSIKRAISSLDQDCELYVVDDCSTDKTVDVLKAAREELKINIQIIKLDSNSGRPAVPRNKALEEIFQRSDVKYVAFLDSDDEFIKDKIKRQIEFLEKNNLGMVCSNAYIRSTGAKYLNLDVNKLTTYSLLKTNNVICSSVLVKTDALREVGYFSESFNFLAYEDYLMWLKLSLNIEIGFLNECLLIYQDDSKNSVRVNDILNDFEKKIFLIKEFRRYALKRVKPIVYLQSLYIETTLQLKLLVIKWMR